MEHNNTTDLAVKTSQAWVQNAALLAAWSMERLVNREDAYGSYLPIGRRIDNNTAFTCKQSLSAETLICHFTGKDVGHLIGLHSTSPDNTSKWLSIDVDNHTHCETDSVLNQCAVMDWWQRLCTAGYSPLLIDSDGAGGYHLIILFEQPMPTADVVALGKCLISNWKQLELETKPELFPKQTALSSGKMFGNWLRLPGRHHTLDRWSKIYSGLDWLSGEDAIKKLLTYKGDQYHLLDGMVDTQSTAQPSNGRATTPHNISGRISKSTAEFVDQGAPEGERNNKLFAAAADLSGNGLSEDEILSSVEEPALRSGLQKTEIVATVKSAASQPRDPSVPLDPPVVSLEQAPFPCAALPPVLRQFVEEVEKSYQCDSSMIALPVLTTCAAAIGNTYRIMLKQDWTEPCVLWSVVVAESGTLKSPVIEAAVKPLIKADLAEPNKNDSHHIQRNVVSDITIEALAVRLKRSPRGLLLYREELAGWFGSFNAYRSGKGNDVAHYLLMHGARSLIIDRKTGDQPTIIVPHAALSILGGIQPDAIRRGLFMDRREDGLAARLLYVMPPLQKRSWTDKVVNEITASAYAQLLDSLCGSSVDALPKKPIDLCLSAAAKSAWIDYYNRETQFITSIANSQIRSAAEKMIGYTARFSLIDHVVRAMSEKGDVVKPEIGEQSIITGVTLADWFFGETKRVYAMLDESDSDRHNSRVCDYIRGKGGTISIRELQRANMPGLNKAYLVRSYLDSLVSQGRGLWFGDTNHAGTQDEFRLVG